MFFAAVLVAVLASPLPTQAPRIPIFVGPAIRDGFVDVHQGVLDSIGDIQDEIRRSRDVSLAATRQGAVIVLEVTARRVSGSSGAVGLTTGGGTVYGGGTLPVVTTMIPTDRHAIDWVLKVGTYEKATTSEDENVGTWKAAAKRVVKDLTAWTAANRERLVR